MRHAFLSQTKNFEATSLEICIETVISSTRLMYEGSKALVQKLIDNIFLTKKNQNKGASIPTFLRWLLVVPSAG